MPGSARKGVPFTISIVALMLCIVGLLSTALLLVGWRSTRALESANIDLHMAALDEAVSDWLAGTLRGTVYAQQVLARTPVFLADAAQLDTSEQVRELSALLAEHAEVSAAYAGYDDGRFVYVGQVGAGGDIGDDVVVPDDAVLLVRLVERQGAEARETYSFVLADGSRTAAAAQPTDFDPRIRPWYGQALARHGAIMTEPYDFAFTGTAGVSVAVPIGWRRGAIGFDFTLENLSRVAAQHRLSPSSIVMVATAEGNVLADSSRCAGCPAAPAGIAEMLRRDLVTAAGRGAGRLDLTHRQDGSDWEVLIDPMPPIVSERFFIASAAPVAEIAVQSARLLREATLVAAVVVLLAVGGVLVAALLLSAGIRRVAQRTGRIRHLDFSSGPPVQSRIREIMLLSDSVERMRAGLEVFGRYVAKDLVRQILRSPDAAGVGGVRREVTIMFTDIEGFSRISEDIEPEVLTGRLSRYFDALGGPIAARRGTIDKFIGDSIMAFWNAPELDERHVEHACRAALEAAAASRRLAEKWGGRGRPAFRTRFGLHTGPAVIGNVGARDRINYTVVGAATNQASRLEGLNKVYGTQILASGAVAAQTADRFVWRHLDTVVPAGTSETVELHELLGEVGDGRDDGAFLARWSAARAAYAAGDFAGAAAAFDQAAALRPDDGPCAVLGERCRRLLQAPPADWTGVWQYDVK